MSILISDLYYTVVSMGEISNLFSLSFVGIVVRDTSLPGWVPKAHNNLFSLFHFLYCPKIELYKYFIFKYGTYLTCFTYMKWKYV
jgi:hypothetical protein